MFNPYQDNYYRARIITQVDADTSRVTIDMGFDVQVKLTIRWQGIDAPERHTDEGKAAIAWLNERLVAGDMCILQTVKDRREKFGRYLGTFYDLDTYAEGTVSLNQQMIEAGHAVLYSGGAR